MDRYIGFTASDGPHTSEPTICGPAHATTRGAHLTARPAHGSWRETLRSSPPAPPAQGRRSHLRRRKGSISLAGHLRGWRTQHLEVCVDWATNVSGSFMVANKHVVSCVLLVVAAAAACIDPRAGAATAAEDIHDRPCHRGARRELNSTCRHRDRNCRSNCSRMRKK